MVEARTGSTSTNGGRALEAGPQSRITDTLTKFFFWMTAFRKWVVPKTKGNHLIQQQVRKAFLWRIYRC